MLVLRVVLVCLLLSWGCDDVEPRVHKPDCLGARCLDEADAGATRDGSTKDSGPQALADAALAPRDASVRVDASGPRDGAATPVDAHVDAPLALDGDAGSVLGTPNDEASTVFDESTLRTYNFVIAASDLAALDAAPSAEVYVPGFVEVDGERHGPLGLRYKGSLGAFLTPCTSATDVLQPKGEKVGKCSLKVDFNRVDKDARFHGLKQLNFHSMGQDASQLRDRLGYAMFREMGVAAPRAVHARVLINGVLEGLFIVVEQVDARFTRSRFSEGGEGNLYKEVWPLHEDLTVYQRALETNQTLAQVGKMRAFKRAIDSGGAAIDAWLDHEYMARYLAVDRVIRNDDGALHWYCFPGLSVLSPGWNHNFYWYEATNAQRLWLVPWDLDHAFAPDGALTRIAPAWNVQAACTCSGEPGQRPSSCDPLTAHWAAANTLYETAIADFLAGPLAEARVRDKLDTWSRQIDSASQEASGLLGAPSHAAWRAAVDDLLRIVAAARVEHGYSFP